MSAKKDIDSSILFRVGASDYIDTRDRFSELLVRIEFHIRHGRKLRRLEREKPGACRELRELKKTAKQIAQIPVYTNLARLPSGFVIDGKYRLESLIRNRRIWRGLPRDAYPAFASGGGQSVSSAHQLEQRGCAASFSSRRRVGESASASQRGDDPRFGVAPGGIPYLAMELLVGRTLADELKEKRVLSLARTVQIILPVCDVLIEAHAATLVHRDIKPENVFLHKLARGSDQDSRLWHRKDAW